MTQGVKIPVRKLRIFKNELKARAPDGAVEVGVLSGAGQHPGSEASIAEVGAFNEFGTVSGGSSRSGGQTIHIPERPWLRTAVPKNKRELNTLLASLLRSMLKGKMSKSQAQGILGETFKVMVQRNIIEIREPANAPSTVEQKKSSNPLIDSGVLRGAIHWIRKDGFDA